MTETELDEKLKLIVNKYNDYLEALSRDAVAAVKVSRPMKGMLKPRFELNQAVSFGPTLCLNTGIESVGLTVADLEAETWQRFDLKREQVARLAEWLTDWLNKTHA